MDCDIEYTYSFLTTHCPWFVILQAIQFKTAQEAVIQKQILHWHGNLDGVKGQLTMTCLSENVLWEDIRFDSNNGYWTNGMWYMCNQLSEIVGMLHHRHNKIESLSF